jgi:hypothetical protein
VRPIPCAAPLAIWGSLFLRGRCAPDALTERFEGIRFVLPEQDPESLIMALVALRGSGVRTLRPLLPANGDSATLPLPTRLHADLIRNGEGVMTEEGPSLVFIEESPGLWRGHPCQRPTHIPDLAWADREIRTSLTEATEALARLVKTSPPPPEALTRLREANFEMELPPGLHARAHRVLALAARVAAIAEFAKGHDAMPFTSGQALERQAHISDLERAARLAIAAATSLSAIDRLDR